MSVIPNYHRIVHNVRPAPSRPRGIDRNLVTQIRSYIGELESGDDAELQKLTYDLRERVRRGAAVLERDVLCRSFALTAEAVRRQLGLVYYDVQLLAGIALSTGAIAEMRTGEGKTIVSALPAALYAMTDSGVHVATVNGYLAERDYQQMRQPLQLLGFTVGLSKEQGDIEEKRLAYRCDVTYSTGYELGFDFLRDQAQLRSQREPLLGESFRDRLRGVAPKESMTVQCRHAFAIIDEVDSVLIDEANTPLILSHSSQADDATMLIYESAAHVADSLVADQDFTIDRRKKTLSLTTEGQRQVYDAAATIPQVGLCRPWAVYVEQALRARHVLKRDADYVIKDGAVVLVDQYTGRIFADRHWRDGLHQAVEFQERVALTPEKQSIARVSRQRYFGLYDLLSGMSGTCTGHERELREFYGLPVVVIPERLPNQRKHYRTRYFANQQDKWQAIANDIASRHELGQPVLVGTRTIDESNILAELLNAKSIPFQLLNGCQDDDEADLIANAGQIRAVTIATNMAGRGTDIKLSKAALAVGGLHVIATQRQESARVDRQLIGRAARQGHPGSCQFFVSADDELFIQYSPQATATIAAAVSKSPQDYSSGDDLDSVTTKVQQAAENQTLQARCELYRQDQWLNEILVTVAEKSTKSLADAG